MGENSKQYHLNKYAKDVIRHKARQLIGKYGFTSDDYEDLKQEMTLDLLERLSRFDRSKSGVNTFVAMVVNRKISNIIRYRTQEKRDYRCAVYSFDNPAEHKDGSTVKREQAISEDEIDLRAGRDGCPEAERSDMRMDVSLVISELPPELKSLAELLLSQSIAQAARELGVPRSTLYEKGIASLREIFEDKGLRDYL